MARDLDLTDHVAFLSFLPAANGSGTLVLDDTDLASLYFWADALLFTTTQEGFGLPVLEAGLAGLPIFCSDLPVLREVAGPHAHYFAPTSTSPPVADLIELVLDVPGAAGLRRRVRQHYSWEGIYERLLLPLIRET
jgi:glycosyltransferase involved in cell wall biosynthesis